MNDMIPPPFVKSVEQYWTLSADEWIRPYIEQCGRLNWDGVFEKVLKSLGDRKGTVVDVGAFIGDSAAWFCDHPLVTFEPQRDAFLCLCHNLPGHVHLPFPAGNGELVQLEFGEGGNMGARNVSGKGETVRTIRIDDLNIQNVAFIKIDVEGWEPNVLKGVSETLIRCRPIVMVEYNKDGLKNCGFTVDDIESHFKTGWRGQEVYRYGNNQWDMLYTPV